MADTDTNELTPEEVDEQNQPLIQDLRRMYPTSAQAVQPLACVQQRLFHSDDGTQQDKVSTPIPQTQMSQQARTSTVKQNRKAWQRLSTLAAAFCAALLVGTLILVLHLAHQSHTGGQATQSYQAEAITSLHMIDATTGWAVAGKGVLRTTDGGNHWRDVTPPGHLLAPGSAADFSTASMAWITIPQVGQTRTVILRTTDGGAHWQQATIQASFVKQITFIDSQYGWLLSGKEKAAGVPAETVSVFRSTDGGKTWQSVSTALFSDATPPGHLPYGGQKSGIHFVNASTGWVTGTVMFTNLAWLYVTHDGGSTWHQQTLPLPQSIPPSQLLIQPPKFFSAINGLLPVRFSDLTTNKDIATVIYVTLDGGTTWRSTMPISAALSSSQFLDSQHWWLTDGLDLFVTSDGGQHWAKLTPSANFKQVTLLDFVSETTGWAISNQGSGSSILLKTMDGGQTWTQITPVIS